MRGSGAAYGALEALPLPALCSLRKRLRKQGTGLPRFGPEGGEVVHSLVRPAIGRIYRIRVYRFMGGGLYTADLPLRGGSLHRMGGRSTVDNLLPAPYDVDSFGQGGHT